MGVLNLSPLRRLHSVIKLSSPQRWFLFSITSLSFRVFCISGRISAAAPRKSLALFATWGLWYTAAAPVMPQKHLGLLHCHVTVVNHVTCRAAVLRLPQQQSKTFLLIFFAFLLTPITVFIAIHLKVIGVSIMHISFLFCNLNLCLIKVNLKSIKRKCTRWTAGKQWSQNILIAPRWQAAVYVPQGNSTRQTENQNFMPKSSKISSLLQCSKALLSLRNTILGACGLLVFSASSQK